MITDTCSIIKSQFRAALEMLQQSIAKCPPALWSDPAAPNQYWHVAYHALFFMHLYLQPSRDRYVAWPRHRAGLQDLGGKPAGDALSQQDVLDYLAFCRGEMETRITNDDFEAPSGFHWLPCSRLELHLYSLRHLQQHVGELSGRLLTEAHTEIDWVGIRP